MRTGPLVRRGANVSRAGQATPALSRPQPRTVSKQPRLLSALGLPQTAEKPAIHLGGRLPINLRSFLAEQLGCLPEANDEAILSFAAHADEMTLNKLARAIRRYSTVRAREAWAECTVALAELGAAQRRCAPALLCLHCVRMDFAVDAPLAHRSCTCLPLRLSQAEGADDGGGETVPEQVQRLVEEFRALRAAFGLSHFDLDCYMHGEQLTLMWRPLP